MTNEQNARRGFSRRRFLQGTAAGAALAATPGLARRAAAGDNGVIRIMGVETAALADWSPFEAQTGLKVEFEGIGSDPGLFRQQVIANEIGDRIDIILIDGGTEDDLGAKGYFAPLTGDGVPSWQGVPDEILKSPLAVGPDGTQYGLPVVMNADSFAYYPEEIGESEPLSFALLFESDKTKGRVALENTWLTTFPMAGMYMNASGRSNIADVADPSPEEAKAIADFLIERKKAGQFRTMWSTWEESIDLLASKEVIVVNCWEPAVLEVRKKGHDVRYASTIEGYNKWMICAYVPTQALERSGPEIAKALEGFLGGAYAAKIAVLRGYATANAAAGLDWAKTNGMSAEEQAAIEANIAKIDKKFQAEQFWQNAAPTHAQVVEAEFERFRLA